MISVVNQYGAIFTDRYRDEVIHAADADIEMLEIDGTPIHIVSIDFDGENRVIKVNVEYNKMEDIEDELSTRRS